jgi:hypothetical protein
MIRGTALVIPPWASHSCLLPHHFEACVHIPFKNRKAVGGTVSANRCYPSGDPPAKQPNLPVVVTFFHRSWLPVEAAGYGDVTIVRSPEKCIVGDSINGSMTDASYLAEA